MGVGMYYSKEGSSVKPNSRRSLSTSIAGIFRCLPILYDLTFPFFAQRYMVTLFIPNNFATSDVE